MKNDITSPLSWHGPWSHRNIPHSSSAGQGGALPPWGQKGQCLGHRLRCGLGYLPLGSRNSCCRMGLECCLTHPSKYRSAWGQVARFQDDPPSSRARGGCGQGRGRARHSFPVQLSHMPHHSLEASLGDGEGLRHFPEAEENVHNNIPDTHQMGMSVVGIPRVKTLDGKFKHRQDKQSAPFLRRLRRGGRVERGHGCGGSDVRSLPTPAGPPMCISAPSTDGGFFWTCLV